MAYSLPLRPLFSWTLGSWALQRALFVSIKRHRLSCTSTPPQRFPSHVTAKLSDFIRLQPCRLASCLSSLALQHFRMKRPFFSRPLGSRPGSFASDPGSPARRVWLPSQRCKHLPSLRNFLPQRSWASLFKAFLHLPGRIRVSPYPLRSGALPKNLPGFLPALQRLDPTETAVPFLAP